MFVLHRHDLLKFRQHILWCCPVSCISASLIMSSVVLPCHTLEVVQWKENRRVFCLPLTSLCCHPLRCQSFCKACMHTVSGQRVEFCRTLSLLSCWRLQSFSHSTASQGLGACSGSTCISTLTPARDWSFADSSLL